MFLTAISTILQASLVCFAYSKLTNTKINRIESIVFVLIYLLSAEFLFNSYNLINTVYLFTVSVLLLARFQKIKIMNSLVVNVIVYGMIFIVSLIVIVFLNIFIQDDMFAFIIHNIVSNILLFLMFRTKKFQKMFKFQQMQTANRAIIPILIIIWIVGFSYVALYNLDELKNTWYVAIIITLLLLGGVIGIIFQNEKHRDAYLSVRKKEHDFGNILNTIGVLVASKPKDLAEKIEEYLSLSAISSTIKTGDAAVDAILDIKLEKAKQLGINTELSIEGEIHTGKKAQDITRVLGILLDNSIDAEPSEIKLNLERYKNILKIKVWDDGKRIKNLKKIFNLGYSTKEGDGRGMGLANVKEIAKSVDVVQNALGKEFVICIELQKE